MLFLCLNCFFFRGWSIGLIRASILVVKKKIETEFGGVFPITTKPGKMMSFVFPSIAPAGPASTGGALRGTGSRLNTGELSRFNESDPLIKYTAALEA